MLIFSFCPLNLPFIFSFIYILSGQQIYYQMKLKVLIFFLITYPVLSQVGIGTTSPNATLDINGDLIIGEVVDEIDNTVAESSILVSSGTGLVKKVSSKQVYESNIKTAIKGNFSTGGTTIGITLGSNYAIVPFNNLDFDVNNEFDTATYTFTAKQDGIYDIYAQINSSGGLAVSTNYGIQILKGTEVIAQQNFANISVSLVVGSINVTPPVRSVQTLVELSENETIQFRLFTNLASVSLLRSKTDSFFTIHQIR